MSSRQDATDRIGRIAIECDKCGKLVDEVSTWHDMRERRVVFTVRCHGETETSTLSELEVTMLGHGSQIVSAVAFKQGHQLEK